jgi:hypothetical protein
MSTINVDNVLPFTPGVTVVDVNGVEVKKETNKPLILWSGVSQSSVGAGVTIVGEEAMINNTGNNNTSVGFGAARTNTTGLGNTSVGHQALYENTTGINNVAIGKDSLFGSLSGVANTAVGNDSLFVCKGDYNVGVGQAAGFALTTGDDNTLIGQQAGNTLTTGSNNTVIGKDAQPATATSSNSITLGNGLISVLRCNATTITSLSDARDKKDVKELSAGLEFLKGLKPVEFTWDERAEEGKHDVKDFGFIAQDLKQSQEDAGLADTLKLIYDENPEKLEASYGKLIPILVKAIQDLTAKVEALESKNKK